MVDTVIIGNATISAVDIITTLYTSPSGGAGTIVTAWTAANQSPTASYRAYIYDSTGASVGAIIPYKLVIKDRFDSGSSIINQVVPPSGTIRVETDTADVITFYATGREQ